MARAAYLHRSGPSGPEAFVLEGSSATLGTAPENDVVVEDGTASRVHGLLERFGGSWTVRDLGSRNGTFVNGERLTASRVLRDGDELRIGRSQLVFRERVDAPAAPTEAGEPAPDLTARERDVLRALCRPLASGDIFTEPAPVARIAAELVVTEAAVKQHLRHLYAKFQIHDASEGPRRVRLANEAMSRGAISLGDLRS